MSEERIRVTVQKQREIRTTNFPYVQQREIRMANFPYVQQPLPESVGDLDRTVRLWQAKGRPVLDALREGGILPFSLCGLGGRCGRCQVRFIKGAPLPTGQERAFLSPERLRQGYRLACLAAPVEDCVLETAFPEEEDLPVLTESFLLRKEQENGTERTNERAQTGASEPVGPPVGLLRREPEEGALALAADLGTTTIAMQLLDKRSGRILDTFTCRNPQGVYGEDVISRIRAGTEGKAKELKKAVTDVLEEGVRRLVPSGWNRGPEQNLVSEENRAPQHPDCPEYELHPEQLVIAGNTAMSHLLLGCPVEGLGKSPFTPSCAGWGETVLEGVAAKVFPGISAFVGGDIVSGLYACGLEAPDTGDSEPFLFLDLGTNAEMALGIGGRIYATAAAAGPAFTGAAIAEAAKVSHGPEREGWITGDSSDRRASGIRSGTGAERIQALAGLLKEGTVDGTGLLKEPYFEKGIVCGTLFLTREDIREIQMAKAAVRAGIHFLKERAGLSGYGEIQRVWLSGGFGFHLDREAAAGVGLIPAELTDRLFMAGNTSLAGARRFALAKDKEKAREAIDGLVRRTRTFNLAEQPDFQGKYIGYMNF